MFSRNEIRRVAPNRDVNRVQPVWVEMRKLDLNHAHPKIGMPFQRRHQHARGLRVKQSKTLWAPLAPAKWQTRREGDIGSNPLVGFAHEKDMVSR